MMTSCLFEAEEGIGNVGASVDAPSQFGSEIEEGGRERVQALMHLVSLVVLRWRRGKAVEGVGRGGEGRWGLFIGGASSDVPSQFGPKMEEKGGEGEASAR
ncbi:hypothetical protein Pint_16535 [Pistacia integerrima]|uniref:Uncharacterized protein n=1 Tax=Pistacia integerrima TaxID=434235 RepID=A0ACC0ZB30_9ROSI|nr:hypothetical protein Pint_16535 [Pistacia integerrima]